MKTLAFFKRKLHLKIKNHEVLKCSLLFTFPYISIIMFSVIVICCDKDEPALPVSNTGLLTSTVWGDENVCGTISSPDISTRIFKPGGIYLEYYRMYQTLYNGTWSLRDNENLTINGDQHKILTLNENTLKIQGGFCTSTFQALKQTKVLTVGVTALSATSARLHGFIRTCDATNVLFEYGTSTVYGNIAAPGNSSFAGPLNTMVNVILSGLSPGTVCHYRIKATNAAGTFYGQDRFFRTFDMSILNDVDNNVYHTITIGSQTWMAENLKTTKYRDGSAISLVRDSLKWLKMSTPGYCWYRNDSVKYKESYGALYNWYAVGTEKICPAGWHVPDDQEWATLIQYMGQQAGSKLTEGRYDQADPLLCIIAEAFEPTNESGFSGRCSGWRSKESDFYTTCCMFWSRREENSQSAYQVEISNAHELILSQDKKVGMNIRCIKD